jgi:hypothetical protein
MIETKKSIKMINTLYYNIRYIIKACRELDIMQDFKESHNLVCSLMLKDL